MRSRFTRTLVTGSFCALAITAIPLPPIAPWVVADASAQSVDAAVYADPLPLEREVEIALARSAAPDGVADAAGVLVLEDGAYEVAEEGTSGAMCYVSRSRPGSLEPHCFDAEGAETILPIHVHRAERGFAGADEETVEREVAEGIASGRFRLPTRPVVSYMLSADQVLYSDDGRRVGAWKPHVMIYQPHWTAEDVGLAAGAFAGPVMMSDPGTADAVLVIVVPDAVEPDLPAETREAVAAASLAAGSAGGR